jgi:hypothetical protein
VNRALVKRLINEYLDGEIGLADKAELERLMAEDPRIRAEYKALRQIGLQLGTMPEIVPHKTRLRARVQHAIDAQSRTFFTPQRVFAGAMAVVLVVLSLSFGMLIFEQGVLGKPVIPAPAVPMQVEAASPDFHPGEATAVLDTWVDGNRFFSRLLIENQLGMLDGEVLRTVLTQTNILEGATCDNNSLEGVKLAYPVRAIQLSASPAVAQQLSKVAEEVSGRSCPVTVRSDNGTQNTLEEFLRASAGPRTINLMLRFK